MEGSLKLKPQVCFEIEKIIGVSSDGNVRSYQVQWAPAWVNSFHLVGCEHLIQEFLQKQDHSKIISSTGRIEIVELPSKSADSLQQSSSIRCSSVMDPKFDIRSTETNRCDNSEMMLDEDRSEEYRCDDHIESDHGRYLGPTDAAEVYSSRDDYTESLLDGEDDTVIVTVEEGNDDMDHEEEQCISDKEMCASFVNVYKESNYRLTRTSNHNTSKSDYELPEEWTDNQEPTNISPLSEKPQKRQYQNGNRKIYSTKSRRSASQKNHNNNNNHSNNNNNIDHDDDDNTDPNHNYTNKPPYSCDLCGKVFPKASSLKRHEQTHLGHRPFPCTICGKGFSQRSHLTRHIRVHTGEKPFTCSICGKAFTDSSDRIRHYRRCATRNDTTSSK